MLYSLGIIYVFVRLLNTKKSLGLCSIDSFLMVIEMQNCFLVKPLPPLPFIIWKRIDFNFLHHKYGKLFNLPVALFYKNNYK